MGKLSRQSISSSAMHLTCGSICGGIFVSLHCIPCIQYAFTYRETFADTLTLHHMAGSPQLSFRKRTKRQFGKLRN